MLKHTLKLVLISILAFAIGAINPVGVLAEDASVSADVLSQDSATESVQPDPGPSHNVSINEEASGNSDIALLSISPLARTSGNTWSKNGNTYSASDGTVVSAEGMGIDVSTWQGTIDWARVKSSGLIDYAIIRCGWGNDDSSQDDAQFINNVRGCQQNGIPFGIYIYSYAYNTSMASSEAQHVLRLLKAAGLSSTNVKYPIYLDMEYEVDGTPAGADNGINVKVSNDALAQIAQTFCSTIEDNGYRAGVYANLNWWNNHLTSSVFEAWSRWVAQYNISCNYQGNYDMWQCMSDGSISGISGNVDVNFDFKQLNSDDHTNWARIYGARHLETMQAVAQKGWSNADTVIIATNKSFHDALAASALAGMYNSPILITNPDSLANQTKSEITRLGAKHALVVGGPDAIASSVDAQIRAAGCTDVQRVYGANSQATAREIAKRVAGRSKTCVIATAFTFQDALSISPYAYWSKSPIFLCEFNSNKLSQETLDSIKQGGYTNAVIVGGTEAVNSSVESQLSGIHVASTRRSGATCYETSSSIANWELQQGMSVVNTGVATGLDYYDALAGGALCGKNGSVLLLVCDYNRSCLTGFLRDHRAGISNGYVFGGPAAVSSSSWSTLMDAYLN